MVPTENLMNVHEVKGWTVKSDDKSPFDMRAESKKCEALAPGFPSSPAPWLLIDKQVLPKKQEPSRYSSESQN